MARGLLECKLGWRVGTGENISIWQDRWVPQLVGNKINTQPIHGSVQTVSQQIDQENRIWKEELISSLFSDEEVEAIKCIPLSKTRCDDCQVWQGEKTGQYIVRNGYKELMSQSDTTEISEDIQMVFKKLWPLSIPAKIKITMWRALRGFLQTGQVLFNRRIRNSAICSRCNLGSESLLHVVADCNNVKEIWDGIGISWDSNLNLETFWHWFIHLVQHKAERIWEKVVIAIWAIWWAHNKQVMEGISTTRQSTIAKILCMVEELKVLNEKLPVIKAVGSDCWRPPQEPWVKLNFDAAYKTQTNKSCSGFIMRDGRGKVMGSGVTHHGNVSDAFMAEAVACFQGLLFAKETGFTTVEVEGDSRTVIEKINQEGFGRADLDSVILDIKSMR
ncbi:uncharacterized protein [Gossypium hirsutum]|uniref:Reverse transcriptase n=1 Tax=Gossypium hirsutum TaxID=3635 RepID=A0A1U8NYQ0_GOSHI|nr:uncharacterized protein LOC107952360 [Gossypium hirsutum]